MMQQAERRSVERLNLRLPLRVRTKGPQDAEVEELTTLENVSSRGAYFFLARELAVDTPVELLVELPEYLPSKSELELNLKGSVVRLERNKREIGRHGIAVLFEGRWQVLPRESMN